MQQTTRSFLGLLISLVVHGVIVGVLLWSWNKPSESANSAPGELSTAISMEMMQGMVMEEPAPDAAQKEPEPEKQEIVEDPTVKPEPKKIKEPEKEKPKPKEKPKEKPKKDVKTPQEKPLNTELPKGDKNVNSSANINAKATTTNPVNANGQVAGSGTDNSEIAAYRSAIRREIERHKRYPTRAKMMRKQGKVSISFNVGADGALTGARIAQSSGDESLDNAALDAVNNARAVGPRPAGFPAGLNVPISFTLQ